MAKTADVQQAIWADPWFLELPPDGKLLYMWAITTTHGNLAGLFVVALPVIQFETGLTPARLEKALEACDGKLFYRAESGVMWVVGRAKNVRSKTTQIAKSIARSVAECPEPEFQRAFLDKYGTNQWLAEALSSLALEAGNSEAHRGSVNLSEVPSLSLSLSSSKRDRGSGGKGKAPKVDPDVLPDGINPVLADTARAVMPTLERVAGDCGMKPVELRAVGLALQAFPDRNHAAVVNELEHWKLHGNGRSKPHTDVVALYRTFLKRADKVAVPRLAPRPDSPGEMSPYDAKTEVFAA